MMVTALRYVNNVSHLDILTEALLNGDVFLCGKIKQFLIHLFIVNVKFKVLSVEKLQYYVFMVLMNIVQQLKQKHCWNLNIYHEKLAIDILIYIKKFIDSFNDNIEQLYCDNCQRYRTC